MASLYINETRKNGASDARSNTACPYRLAGKDGDKRRGVRILFRIKEACDEREREHCRVLEAIVLPRKRADLLQHARAAPVASQQQLMCESVRRRGGGGETRRKIWMGRRKQMACK